jgi:hypothetical protein
VGEAFTPTVTAVYADSSYGILQPGSYTLSPENPTAGANDNLAVSASYAVGDITKVGSVSISVKEKNAKASLNGITISSEKREWKKGEAFRVNVVASYSDGTQGVIEQGYYLNPAMPTVALGYDKPVQVTYKDKRATLAIDVVEGTPTETLEKFWANYTNLKDWNAQADREAAMEYAREMFEQKHFHGSMIDAVIAEFGMFVYVYSHLGNSFLTPEEYENEFVKSLDSNAPVWVEWPYSKKGEVRLMHYKTVQSNLRQLIDSMRVRVCTGLCPPVSGEKKAETVVDG